MALPSSGLSAGAGDACLFGLSLCSGAGGLDLGLHLACPGYRTVGHVERDAYAAAVLVARMEDAALDQAVVWDDVATFDGGQWRGAVDIVTAGYPCQPFSVAGKRRGADDPRHLWPHVARIVGEIEPPFVFLENVAHHLRLSVMRDPVDAVRAVAFAALDSRGVDSTGVDTLASGWTPASAGYPPRAASQVFDFKRVSGRSGGFRIPGGFPKNRA